MLDEKILEQVKQVIGLIKYPVELATSLDYSEQSKQTSEILHQIAGLSDLIQGQMGRERAQTILCDSPG